MYEMCETQLNLWGPLLPVSQQSKSKAKPKTVKSKKAKPKQTQSHPVSAPVSELQQEATSEVITVPEASPEQVKQAAGNYEFRRGEGLAERKDGESTINWLRRIHPGKDRAPKKKKNVGLAFLTSVKNKGRGKGKGKGQHIVSTPAMTEMDDNLE